MPVVAQPSLSSLQSPSIVETELLAPLTDRRMSYDLMVFEPEAAPKNHDAFMERYFALTKWKDGPYDDSAQTFARLRAWVQEMQRTFPDIKGPEAEIRLQDDEGVLGDYTIGRQFVYAGFAWSKAVAAAGEAERLAKLHGVGFFDVSSDGEEVWLPVNGTPELAHQKKRSFLERLRPTFRGRRTCFRVVP
jgi:hypothetical protein